jgi:hypothetical protein
VVAGRPSSVRVVNITGEVFAARPRRGSLWWPVSGYAVCCAFAGLVVLFSGDPMHRLWGAWAAAGYGCAALISLSRQKNLALATALTGALLVPLCWLATAGRAEPEIGVVERAATLLIRDGRMYELSAQVGHDPYGYNPYLPGMTLFGLPHALAGSSVWTDPRLWAGAAFAMLLASALCLAPGSRLGYAPRLAYAHRLAQVPEAVRRTGIVLASPLVAFPLSVSADDLPVIGLIVLGLALADTPRGPGPAGRPGTPAHPQATRRAVASGLALGAAAAMKATAWPALLVVGVLFAVRNGPRAAARFAASAIAVIAAVVVPVAAIQPRALVQNTILYPLGMTSAASPAASPLPGHLLAAAGPAGHLAAVLLLAAGGIAMAATLIRRPPRTARSAADYVAAALTLLFTLAPATRWGYFAYPLVIYAWLVLCPSGAQPPYGSGASLSYGRGRAGERLAGYPRQRAERAVLTLLGTWRPGGQHRRQPGRAVVRRGALGRAARLGQGPDH